MSDNLQVFPCFTAGPRMFSLLDEGSSYIINQQKKGKVGFPTDFLVQNLNAECFTGQVARSELQTFDIEKKYGP